MRVAGAEGIEQGLKLPKELDVKNVGEVESLPEDLMSAIELAKNSEFIARYIPRKTLDKFFEYEENEYKNYSLSKDKDEFVTKTYFNKI